MRKVLVVILIMGVLFLNSPALANQWGRSGEMLRFLEQSGAFDDYPYISSGYDAQAEFFAFVAGNAEENQLVVLRRHPDGRLEQVGRYPGAVLQPQRGLEAECWVAPLEKGFRITPMWSEAEEHYTFTWNGEEMVLAQAVADTMTYTLAPEENGYTATDGFDQWHWLNQPLTLAEFRMDMLPKSTGHVWLGSIQRQAWGQALEYGQRVQADFRENRTLPVYAAPSESGYRGAGGKAAVSLAEPFHVLAAYPGGWHLVEYDISAAEKRIGFVQGLEAAEVPQLRMEAQSAALALDTQVTDDPHGSMRAMTTLPAGTGVEVLGCLDAFWAYIRTAVNGQEAWGFVPLTALTLPQNMLKQQTMQRLQGTWRFIGGGEVLGFGAIFAGDGTLTLCDTDDYETFPPENLIPRAVAAAWGVYDDGAGEKLVVWGQKGEISVYRLSFQASEAGVEQLSLTWGEGGGGYERYEQGE